MPESTAEQSDVERSAVVAEMTVEEKALFLEGVKSWTTNGVPRLGIPGLFLTDGPHGVRKVRASGGAFDLADSVPATSFPTAVTLASSWNPENARLMGQALARECRARDVDVLLAPGVNIKRNPLCGRNFEYYSEDPLVSGAFGTAFVQGVEGEGVATSLKHLAANSTEDFRFVGNSVVDERALREIYLPAFRRVVQEGRPATVMAAYNALNGTFCSEHRELLTTILRDEWGFDGVVMTDWGAMHDRVASLEAGCELDMPGESVHNRREIIEGLADGRLSRATLDEAVRRMLALTERSTRTAPVGEPADEDAHADLARDIAVDGAVLLANDGVLPLAAAPDGLVIIGDMFAKMRFQGSGSSLINPPYVVTPRDAFDRRRIGYRYAPGYRTFAAADAALEQEAINAARAARTVLFFGGLDDLEESEGFDRTSMALGSVQTSLLRRVLDTGARVVLVLFAGAPVELPFVDELAAVLDMHLPGMCGGEATAALLFGDAVPSGKLAESWPMTAADASSSADWGRDRNALYYESIYVGYRFYDTAGTALRFPFGHGLSYTTFDYSDVSVRSVGGRVEVEFTLTNTGDRDGAEVVQVYVRNNDGPVFKAEKELRAFDKVALSAGESRTVSLSFALSDLAYWDVSEHDWVLENGRYEVVVAASAADVRLEAPLVVDSGREPRSPYSALVAAAYATPPTVVPACFDELIGGPVPTPSRSNRLTMETRLIDGRRSIVGGLMYAGILGRMRAEYRRSLALPDSPDRDARVKNAHGVMRMMGSISLRSMSMSSAGALPYAVAAGIADLAAFHPVRGLRKIIAGTRRREPQA